MLLQQSLYAIRTLVRARGFTLAAVLSLALGIGGNLAIFSLLNAVVLKPLPYPDPDRLVLINEILPKSRGSSTIFQIQGGHIVRWRTQLKSFASVGGANGAMRNLTEGGQPESLEGVQMTADFFDVLGLKPQLGRWFRRSEEQIGQPDVVILSDSLWRRRFSADPHIVGRKIMLDKKPHEVVGVTPAGMRFQKGQVDAWLPENPELFIPLRLPQWELAANTIGSLAWCVTIARLKHGATLDQARAEIETYLAGFSRTSKEHIEVHSLVQPLHKALVGDTPSALMVLMGAVAFVLLIACVNVANLVLVRAARTRHELIVKSALGASMRHLVCQSLFESFFIAVTGAALGILAAFWIIDLLVAGAPTRLPRLEAVTVDRNVLLFSAALCILTTLLFGLLPALHISRISPLGSLCSTSRRQTGGRGENRFRALLLGIEVGFATLLLIGTGLFLASFERVMNAPRGFETQNIHTAVIALPKNIYQSVEQKVRFFRQLEKDLSASPGVEHVAYANALPLSGISTSEGYTMSLIKTGADNLPEMDLPIGSNLLVSPDYLSTLGIPLRTGRFFKDAESPGVAVVSETAARRLWPGQNPIGQQFHNWRKDDRSHWFTVIGVVGNVRSTSLEYESLPTVYVPYWQPTWSGGDNDNILVLYVRTQLPNVVDTIRKQVRKIGPHVGVEDYGNLRDVLSNSVSERRFQAMVVAAFGVVALALACIGVYGVASYSIAQRQKEIGIRMALGARGRNIVSMVFRLGVAPVLGGIAAGLIAALALSHLISSMLFEVQPVDPATFTSVPMVLALFAALACYLPAKRGAETDPAIALRAE